MKRIIVFGATGNLGAYIAMHLKEQGYDVIAVGGRKDDRGFFASHGMQYLSVDIRKPDAFNVLPTEGVDAVCHFAGALPSRYAFDPVELFESITIGTLNVLNWMVKCGCKKIVFPQTPSDMAKYHYDGSVITDEA
ncbi:MAG: NAD(P)-dependent oxidoreductase, partial [Muribaculaceae bacterium]|nr:NAD(P)-dependent oxidoreductase [Muribaculaceae bacterium]